MNTKHFQRAISPTIWQSWMGHWAELIQSGMPVLDALALSTELQNSNRQARALQVCLHRTAQFLEKGQSLQTAFRASCGALPMPLEVALLCAQANGDLGTALQDQLHRWRSTTEANQALGRSLIYPGVVLLLAIACWVFLHHVASPHSASSLQPTSQLLGLSEILLLAGGAVLTLAACIRTMRKPANSDAQFKMPHKAWLASNFHHVIACELQAGLDLLYCLRHRVMPSQSWRNVFTQDSTTTRCLNQLMARIQLNLKQGMSLSQAMQAAQAPSFLIRQSQLAEQTGNLAYCFFLAAKVYEMQAIEAQRKLQGVLPPIALAVAALTLAMAYQFTLAPLYNNLTGLS